MNKGGHHARPYFIVRVFQGVQRFDKCFLVKRKAIFLVIERESKNES